MQRQHPTSFSTLRDGVLSQLSEQHFLESTITNYRRIYNRIERFMQQNKIDNYDRSVGEGFLHSCFDDTHLCKSSEAPLKCAVRRLDDYISGYPFRPHHGYDTEAVSATYREVFNEYLLACAENGNKPATLSAKSVTCARFLNHIESMGCMQLGSLTSEMAVQALLIFKNKDRYAIIRSFLRFLADRKYIPVDFSGIVPKYKRQMPVPSIYTVDEIRQIESAIDQDTDIGRRDITIIMLASRLGLRAGDIASLRFDEIDFDAGEVHIIQEKTGVPLTLAMPGDVSESLLKHVENVKGLCYPDNFVFHSFHTPYARITTSAIRHILNGAIKKAGIDTRGRKHGPHALRSSLASSMVNDDVSYDIVRKILGHTDADAIKHYARIDIERLRLCAVPAPPPSGAFQEYLDGRRWI